MRGQWAIVAGLASLCVGCGSLLETKLPESTSYVLAPAPASSTGVTRSEADLSIGRPDLAPGLDTERIAVLKGRQLDYYRGAQWGGRMVEVVQTLLVDSFEDQQLFRSVTSEQSRVASEYVLDISVRDFQAEYAGDNGAPTAHVTILGRLIRVVDRQLVDTFAATAQSKATDDRLGPVAAAFETAAHKVVLELAQKTATAIAGDAEKLKAAGGEVQSTQP
ncbi:MAG TPA: ABC-type transport auxiliary lipoprotein family protein [Steroidobacteraceae bacterium]|jgi:cholesterol transport system auxiliary component|nr:ABC-type transport auxiliary lipoprotein family protein [Steroidobacteraceae bacterium]